MAKQRELKFNIIDHRELSNEELNNQIKKIDSNFKKIDSEDIPFFEKTLKITGLFMNMHYCLQELSKRDGVSEEELKGMIQIITDRSELTKFSNN